WNLGPYPDSCLSVGELAQIAAQAWGHGAALRIENSKSSELFGPNNGTFHEAPALSLDISKTLTRLGWKPRYNARRAVTEAIRWYVRRHRDGARFDARGLCQQQLLDYERELAADRQGAPALAITP